MFDCTICSDKCPKGRAFLKQVLNDNNSAFDAAVDMWQFVDKCRDTCDYEGQEI